MTTEKTSQKIKKENFTILSMSALAKLLDLYVNIQMQRGVTKEIDKLSLYQFLKWSAFRIAKKDHILLSRKK